MKNIWCYGENIISGRVETDFDTGCETGTGIVSINDTCFVNYWFDGKDWTVYITGSIPKDWIIKSIVANSSKEILADRNYENVGQFIHIQIPDNYEVIFEEVEAKNE